MARAKEFRLSASRLSGSDDLLAVCIPYWFRDILLDATERFLWSRVWTDNEDHPHTLTEDEITRIEYAIHRLSLDEFCWEEMMPPITIEVNPVITINPTSQGDGCCNATSPPPWENAPWPPGSPTYPIPPVNPPVEGMPPIPPEGTTESEWDLFRCKAANYAYDNIRQWFVSVSEIPSTLSAIGAILIIIWAIAPAGLLALIGVGVLELASVVWAWYALSEGIDEIGEFAVNWWDERHQEMVCKLYDMTDFEAAQSEVVAEFLDDLAIWAEGRPWWTDSLLAMLQNVGGHLFPAGLFLAPWEIVPPTNYVGSIDCSLCGDVTPTIPDELPTAPEGYTWVYAPTEAITFTPNNSSATGASDGAGIFTHAPNPPQNYHEVAVGIDVSDVLAFHSVNNLYGIAVRVQQYPPGGQMFVDGLRLSSDTGGALDLLAVTNLSTFWFHYSSDNTAASMVSGEFDHSSTYGNAEMSDVKASFESRTYGTIAPASMVYDVWYLAEL